MKYSEYFDVNESYFPCIDESAIKAGASWEATYPHETFISLLNDVEKMLAGSTKRSVWIHGAYGTGKSQCAFALKRILEVPEDEVRAYWGKYEALEKHNALLEKLIGHKEQGIITAYRYASGSITTPQQLFLAVQESLKTALEENNVQYKGNKTLKEAVVSWMEEPAQKAFVNALLQKPKWISTFSQSSVDEIINTLKKSDDVSELMDNIFKMAAEEGITALSLNADILREWIVDIVKKNNIKLVLIWDEFSDFFRQNKHALGEFQKIVSICQEAPFYFVIVTHPITSLSSNDDSWKIVQQRFDLSEIALPDNIAFDLIGAAFSVKDAAKTNWNAITDDLDARVIDAKNAIMKAANITKPKVMRSILPIHPVAALVLKNIASGFQSNQRSMFDFIKTSDTDVHAFQWFIENNSPMDDRPLLTVDMLWDFFYEKGKNYLTSDIKLILDTFGQQTMLNEKEKTVLKTILIMQAIDQRLGGQLAVLKPTDQNLSYAFQGIDELESACKGIAKGLVDKGVLILTPIADGKKVYSTSILAGDGAKIEGYKNDIRKASTTVKLVQEGGSLGSALSLTPALKLRYSPNPDVGTIPVATISDFTKYMDILKNKDVDWHFYAILAVAKDDDEAIRFRTIIKDKIRDEAYKHIVVIDALSTPLGLQAFEEYVEYSAMSQYYQGNNNQQSKDNARKAKEVLERDWKNRIKDGNFIVYTYANQDGEKATGSNAVQAIMQTIVLNRFRHALDFAKGLSESQLKLTQAKQVARYGLGNGEVKGLIAGAEKAVLSPVWGKDKYWEVDEWQLLPIVIMKKSIDKMITDSFVNKNGKVSIDEIYDYLETTFGFAPSNLSAFVTGFLLKEYSSDPYRCTNAEGFTESMTPDKLAEMIGNYININKKPKPTYIVRMTEEEKAFYDLTEEAWGITPNTCSSPAQATSLVLSKMREFGFPVWCLEDVDNVGVFDIVKKYLQLVQSKDTGTHNIANEIGKIAIQRPSIAANLRSLLTAEKCKEGMLAFLQRFENGKLLTLAEEIGAKNEMLSDIKRLFSVQYSALWIGSTGEDEIKKLITEYDVVKQTNLLLNVNANNKDGAFKCWRETLKFIGFSCEAVRQKKPLLDKFFYYLLKVANREDMLADSMKNFLDEIKNNNAAIRDLLNDKLTVFAEIYAPYLEGFSLYEIEKIRDSIIDDLFISTATASNLKVKSAAEKYKKDQIKGQLFDLWREKTNGTKNPKEWSSKFLTPILACIKPDVYAEAKKVFTVMNSFIQTEKEIKEALEFVQNATFFGDLASEEYRNDCFVNTILGEYKTLLSDISKIKDKLSMLPVEVYDWIDSPIVKNKIKALAEAEYNAGGSDQAVGLIDAMSDAELKARLKELVQKDIELGIKIIKNGRK